MMPNFFIVGANKAGTTSLHHYLSMHPSIFMSSEKEPMYFTLKDASENTKKVHSLQNHMVNAVYNYDDYIRLFKDSENYVAIGESSTAYLCNPKAPVEIKKLIPNAKIIVILREPIERAISNYKMYVDWGYEKNSFEKVINSYFIGKNDSNSYHNVYLKLGLYYSGVAKYIELFSIDNVRVYLFEDFKQSPESVLKDICSFLCVDNKFKFKTDTIHNKSVGDLKKMRIQLPNYLKPIVAKIPGELKTIVRNMLISNRKVKHLKSAETINKLKKYYEADICNLEKTINIDLTHWKCKSEWF